MPMPKRAAGLAIALLLFTAAACEIEIGNFSASVGSDSPSYAITLYQDGGVFASEQVKFDEVKDAGPLVVYYFNGQCEQCVGELRLLQKVASEYQDEPTVLAVDIGPATGMGDSEDAKALLIEAGAAFPAGFTTDESIVSTHEIETIPTIAFYRNEGHYRSKLVGILTEEDLREGVEDILK